MSEFDRLFSILSNNLVGFDSYSRYYDLLTSPAASFPPVNIYREQDLPGNASDSKLQEASGHYIIQMALSGYSSEDVDVSLEPSRSGKLLTVQSTARPTNEEVHWINRGIASRAFKRTFALLDNVNVVSAELVNGLLTIRLAVEAPERNVIKIPVTTTSSRPALTAETHKQLPKIEEVEEAATSRKRK